MSTRIISKTVVALAFLACAGCAPPTSDIAKGESEAIEPVVYRDSVTGCEYLTTGQMNALTPRADSTGKQICKAVRP